MDVDDKIETYLRAGSSLVIVVDSRKRIVVLHDRLDIVQLNANETIEHAALPGFAYPVQALFAVLQRP